MIAPPGVRRKKGDKYKRYRLSSWEGWYSRHADNLFPLPQAHDGERKKQPSNYLRRMVIGLFCKLLHQLVKKNNIEWGVIGGEESVGGVGWRTERGVHRARNGCTCCSKEH